MVSGYPVFGNLGVSSGSAGWLREHSQVDAPAEALNQPLCRNDSVREGCGRE